MITVEQLKQRLSELEAQKQQAVAKVHCIDGAMQDCEYWLAEVEKASALPLKEDK